MASRSLNVSKKIVSVFAAAMLVFGAFGISALSAPTAAYADDSGISAQAEGGASSGQIGVNTVNLPVVVKAGQSVNIAQYFSPSAQGGPWHVDYKITSGTAYANVNKHSGILTGLVPTPEGTLVTVTAYVESGEMPTGNNNNPCYQPSLASASLTVKVEAAGDYGYQGNPNAMMMLVPSSTDTFLASYTNVAYASGDQESGYVNTLTGKGENGSLVATGDYYYFTFETTSGFRNYNTPALFAQRNAGNVTLTQSGASIISLNARNTGDVTIDSVNVDAKQITVKVAKSAITGSSATLNFTKDFVGNNNNNKLNTNVAFNFTVK